MSNKPIEIGRMFNRDDMACAIAHHWQTYNMQRNGKIAEWKELRNYIFATDTTSTSNQDNPWKNSTTLPKLCQIRDNLHSNYISALFPNDDWLRWEAYDQESATQDKKEAITSYMSNKIRQSNFRSEVSKLLYDYIDYGNSFATVDFKHAEIVSEDGSVTTRYIGPVVKRISPLDIVFNPLAASFEDSHKILRSIVTKGELLGILEDFADQEAIARALKSRSKLLEQAHGLGTHELGKSEGIAVDGFGSYYEYLTSDYCEILTFYGDIHNNETGEYTRNRKITVIDRMWVVADEPIVSWTGQPPLFHVGWRTRPDNLWGMGPLDNLVGMQYRIDHLQNSRADAYDIAIHPPIVVKGEVDMFKWQPGGFVHIDGDGDISEMGKNVQWVLQAENDIQALEARMEMFAGAPREAMGIRTAGEKTAYEVQQLQNAAGRIFQEKITTFEIEMLENVLNAMLETARRNLSITDTVKVMDNTIGAESFLQVTRDDITATGKIRPIGARHFAAQAQMLQNITGVFNSNLMEAIRPHISGVRLAELVEDILGLQKFSLVRPNVAVMEAQETETLKAQATQEVSNTIGVAAQEEI